MIDQVTGPWTHKKSACPIGRAEGRAECEATHDRLIVEALGVVADASEAEYATGTQDAFARGEARGRAACEKTHDDLAGSFFDSGWEDGYEEGQARGRVQGAVVVGLLVWVAWVWRRR